MLIEGSPVRLEIDVYLSIKFLFKFEFKIYQKLQFTVGKIIISQIKKFFLKFSKIKVLTFLEKKKNFLFLLLEIK